MHSITTSYRPSGFPLADHSGSNTPVRTWQSWTQRYCSLQQERARQSLQQVQSKEDKMVYSVLDLVLLRSQSV